MSHNISIIIPARKYNYNLFNTIKAVNKQSYLPIEIIIVSNEKINTNFNLSKKISLKKITTKIKNQIYQRNIAINNLSKKSDLILQLDDRVILYKECLKELNKFWNKADPFTAGVGLNQINRKKNISLVNRLLKKYNGKVLSNGMNIDYSNAKNDYQVMWLKGGLSSWKIKINKRIRNRKYPLWKWSVFEDVDFSLNKKNKQKLFVSHKSKAKIIYNSSKFDFLNLIYRGTLHAYSQKRIVKKYFKNMTFFLLTIPLSIILSLIVSIITINHSKFVYNIGRIRGLFIIRFD